MDHKSGLEEETDVLFVRGTAKNESCTSSDDAWDDSALIKAYDKAVNLAKDEVAKRIGMDVEVLQEKSTKYQNKKSQQRQKSSRKWTIGSPCRAVYSTDGEIYEAIITKIKENSGICVVKFIGYGNTEKVEISSLLESNGLQSQIAQQKRAAEFNQNQLEFNENHQIESEQTNSNSPIDAPRGNDFRSFNEDRMDYETEKPRLPKNLLNPGVSFNSSYGIMPPAPPIPPQLMAKLPDNDADALSSMLMSWYISGFHTGYYHGMKQARHLEEKRKK